MTGPPARLRICLYYPWLYLTSGGERTILEIVRRSRHRITIVTNEYQPEATYPGLRDADIRVLPRVPVQRTLASVARAAWRIGTQRLDLDGYDAVLVVCEGLGDLSMLRPPDVPAFCLCLTPLRIVFDGHYRAEYLRSRQRRTRAAVALGSPVFAALDRWLWRRYRRVFTISREVERRILAGRLAPRERLHLLHPGVEVEAYSTSDAPDRVFFVPGRIMWTKNLELAIEAFRLFRKRVADPSVWRLQIAGMVDAKSQPYLERLRAMAAGDPSIEFIIHPGDREMRARYANAFATLFTAFNEDWGLVIIEAMASGVPVVASNRGGPKEIITHGADGLLADPDPEAFADAMARLAGEPGLRAALGTSARTAARRYDWSSFVSGLDAAIETDLLATGNRSPAWAGTGAEVRG